ncbi:MAG TPA: tetratricopeptide repeat protein [Polyangiaceae bacterium]|nr:tetratricopeptide repeat protein [Polyangiaceae bacterium]
MTVALCEALRGSTSALIEQVGQFATKRHASDPAVLVSVARMYIDADRYGDAQNVLVSAGKQAPHDAEIYRWLGEVLLRRGDAERAEKVLKRAIQLGSAGPEAAVWLERARVFKPMQASAGIRAVAAEVAHTAPPARELLDSLSETTTDVHLPRPDLTPGAPAARAAPATKARALLDDDDDPTDTTERQYGHPFDPPAQREGQTYPASFDPPAGGMFARAAQNASVPSPSPSSSGEIDISVSAAAPVPLAPPLGAPVAAPAASARPATRTNGAANGVAARAPAAVRPRGPAPLPEGTVPHPRDVLDALTFAGVFEPHLEGVGRPAAWDRPNLGPKRKGSGALVGGMVLFVAASVGTYVFYQHKRAGEHVQAEAILANVEKELHAAKPETLPQVEQELSQALQLESRSPRAALDWTIERALVGLVRSGEDIAFEDAMTRAKEVGVPEDKYAFARVASFLVQGDTAGAAAVLPRWDGPAAGNAWYQLVAGAALERAGDPRARDRYVSAAKLDPDLTLAQVGLTRVTAVSGDPQEGMKLAKELRIKLPDRAEPVALVALAWGRDPLREDAAPPPEVDQVKARAEELPTGLKFVPPAVAALSALDKHAADDVRAAIQKGLTASTAPGPAVWLGTIALQLGDEALARKAALAALQLSAAYEPARALAARVALLGGRLDEALKATEDLDPTSPDVAVVRSASAYERLDADGAARGFEALPADVRKQPFAAALATAPEVLNGHVVLDPAKLLALAEDDDAPWSNLVAMDMALDGGDLASADKIAAAWGKEAEALPLSAIRLARLARYENRLDAADALSQAAMASATVTPRLLIERVFVLVARSRAADVGPLLAKYPLVLGPLATWLSAYATASNGQVDAAKGKTASIDPPPASAPLEARVAAAAAFGAMKDRRRGGDYVHEALQTGSLDPDLVSAALALGFHKVDHYKRRPTYE